MAYRGQTRTCFKSMHVSLCGGELKQSFQHTWESKVVECEEGVGVNLFTVVVPKQQVVSLLHAVSHCSPANENM